MNRKILFRLFALVACLLCSLGAVAAEAYACYTSSDSTLTFYYDNLRSSRMGATYDMNTGTNKPGWLNGGIGASITDVVFDPTFANASPTTTYRWFYEMGMLKSINNLSYLNTANVTNMREMFSDCAVLTSLDLSGFNTANVTTMHSMFNGCGQLTSLDLSSFNTANVSNMAQMFNSCSSLTSLDLGSFNTANVTDMYYMFYNCTSLTSLDISSFDTHNVVNMNSMFKECSNLATIYAGSEWSTAAVTNSLYMFTGCINLVGGQGTTFNYIHDGMEYAHIDGGSSNPGYFTEPIVPLAPEAYACYTSSNTTLTFYYDNQRSTRTGTTYDLNEGISDPGWDTDGSYTSVTRVVFDPSFADARPTSTSSWFWGMRNLQSIDGLDYMNTEDVTLMWGMFTNCSSLTSIDASNFNTSKVTNALNMFSGCTNLTTIYGGDGWNTSSMSVSSYMFTDCVNLVGGKGTTYDASHTNKVYARIDGGPSNPGYFTEKVDFVRGDVNGDNNVTIADVSALIDYLLDSSNTVNMAGADCNTDNDVTIADVSALIDYLLYGYW